MSPEAEDKRNQAKKSWSAEHGVRKWIRCACMGKKNWIIRENQGGRAEKSRGKKKERKELSSWSRRRKKKRKF